MAKSEKKVHVLTAKKMVGFKAKLAPQLAQADIVLMDKARLSFDQAWSDIHFCLDHPIQPPKLPVGMVRSMDAAKVLDHIQKRRNKLTGIKIACIRAKQEIEAIIGRTRSWLLMQPEIRELKNEGLRNAAIRRAIGGLEDYQTQIKAIIDAVESLLWNIKDNQYAMDLAYKEITWLQKNNE